MGKDIKKKPAKEVKEAEQNLTETEEVFKPTKNMIKWVEVAIELGHTATILAVSKKAKVSRTSWYTWIRDSEFVKWWDSAWQGYLRVNRWKLDAIGMKKAQTDYDYWKDMMERTGNIVPQPSVPQLATQVNVNLDKYIK